MPFRSSPYGTRYNGFFRNMIDGTLDLYEDGTKVATLGANVNFPVEVEFAANIHIQSTIEAGADGVGSDGEQLTSGGAAAEVDWSASGV
jgi:hypothetical protein